MHGVSLTSLHGRACRPYRGATGVPASLCYLRPVTPVEYTAPLTTYFFWGCETEELHSPPCQIHNNRHKIMALIMLSYKRLAILMPEW